MITDQITAGGTIPAPVVSSAAAGPVPQTAAAPSGATGREVQPGRGDTVTLQGKVQETKTATVPQGGDDGNADRMGSVLFSYNSKGDLRIRFMDSSNTLVYQTPPVMVARLLDIMRRADTSVNSSV